MGEVQQRVLTITQEVPLFKLDATGLPDYNEIVKAAAEKLETDFKKILGTLSKIYSSS